VVDGEEEAELQGATATVLLLGLGSCGDGIGLDAIGDREETGGAMAAVLSWLAASAWVYPQTVAARRAGSGRYNDGRIRRTRRPCGL
jgi:hypothetical protein